MPIFDCVRCGACCANTDQNRAEGFVDYVEVFRSDGLMRRRELLSVYTVKNAAGQVHMKLHPDGRCLALEGRLGEGVRCAIYPSRPGVCRKVTAGSDECLRARREQGIDPG